MTKDVNRKVVMDQGWKVPPLLTFLMIAHFLTFKLTCPNVFIVVIFDYSSTMAVQKCLDPSPGHDRWQRGVDGLYMWVVMLVSIMVRSSCMCTLGWWRRCKYAPLQEKGLLRTNYTQTWNGKFTQENKAIWLLSLEATWLQTLPEWHACTCTRSNRRLWTSKAAVQNADPPTVDWALVEPVHMVCWQHVSIRDPQSDYTR
jgi:hypothetical protein